MGAEPKLSAFRLVALPPPPPQTQQRRLGLRGVGVSSSGGGADSDAYLQSSGVKRRLAAASRGRTPSLSHYLTRKQGRSSAS